jgi:xanthine dehydrogenase accessory factor
MGAMDLFERIASLRRDGQAFALATVVARRPPVSAHLGDRAIVLADGRMEGFVGGACSHEIVRRQALDTLRTRTPRLVSIRPDAARQAGDDTAEHVTIPMACASEGAIDVYVEPFVQPRRLLVIGATPVAQSLARVGRAMDYDVVRLVDTGELHDIQQEAAAAGASAVALDALDTLVQDGVARGLEQAAVVASQGHYDETALERLLAHSVPYVGLVASRKRAATVRAVLEQSGVQRVDSIRNPAGLDLGARTPAEVALSILAEIVQVRPAGAAADTGTPAPHDLDPNRKPTAIDPVCGMEVEVDTARYRADVDGTTYYFCCASCRSRFLENPKQFQVAR